MIGPSKKIIALGIICISIVVITLLTKVIPPYVPQGELVTTIEPDITLDINTKADNTDSDSDGLLDWQEILWNTNPNNKDTDGDKSLDGDEVRVGRDPLVAGPNDKQVPITEIRAESDVPVKIEDNSVTSKLSRDLFYALAYGKQQRGVAFSQEDIRAIADSLKDEASPSVIITKYSIDAIGTFPDEDLTRGKLFGEKFANIYIPVIKAIDSGPNDAIFIAKQYETLSRNLSALYVPESLQKSYAELVNNIYNTAITLVISENYEKDPLKAVQAIKSFQELSAKQPVLFTTIANYFRRNDIIFTDTETNNLWQNF